MVLRCAAISRLSRATASASVVAGATTANQPLTPTPGANSLTWGDQAGPESAPQACRDEFQLSPWRNLEGEAPARLKMGEAPFESRATVAVRLPT